MARNPRVVKEATALAAAGYEVSVLAPRFADELAAEDAGLAEAGRFRVACYCDLRPARTLAIRRLKVRVARRLGAEACRRLAWQSPMALGYGVRQLLGAAGSGPSDLVIGHQEVGAWAATRLGRRGFRVGADFEDWYSEDLLPEARRHRPLRLLRACEAWLVQHGAHVTTTSEAMAGALSRAYRGAPPRVIYNAFPWSDRAGLPGRPDRGDRPPSLHWVSQTIGRGRGLETLFAALRQIRTPVAVHLRGRCAPGDEHWVSDAFPAHMGHSLTVHPLIPNSALLAAIAEHDIGLALEQPTPPNHDLTVSNKILHYLLAGLAVVASATAGQREVAARAGTAVRLFPPDDPDGLARALGPLLTDRAVLAQARADALEAARQSYCWERQVPVLVDSVADAIGRAVRGGPPAAGLS